MKIFSTVLLWFLFCWNLLGQDAYHQALNTTLMTDYNLPQATWIMSDTETGNYSQTISYGGSENQVSISDQDFTIASQIVINQAGNNPWDSGWKGTNVSFIQNGDKLLLVLWLRSIGGNGKANIFVERTSDFAKEIYVSVDISEEWTQYYISFEATTGNYTAGQLSLGLHLGLAAQTLQIGGFTAINYGASVALDDLPSDLNNDEYGGFEADAPWRALAVERIEQLRKANLTIRAERMDGTPIPDAAFDIEMTKHEFAFGSAITAARIAGNNDQNIFYENKIADLDGKGHGFNWVVFENDLKWDGWEEEWFVNNEELVNAVAWLNERAIKIRGHTLVWPGYENLPDDIQDNAGNADYIWNRINGRLEEILEYPGLEADKIPEWDVLNEIVTNTSLESTFATVPGNTTGREFYADIFKRAKEISPNTEMYINDFVTLTLNNTGGGQYDVLKSKIQEILDAGAPLEGIGFQGHIGSFPNGIPSVLGTLDDFYDSFGLPAKITEFDLPPNVSEELAANYLRDFLTAVFSHESINGFLFWNFWDGATWRNPGANMYRLDWSRTPAGDTFIDLVFKEWWTDVLKTTDASGDLKLRGFKGEYNITYVCNGETVTETLNLIEDQAITIMCDDLQTNIFEINPVATLEFEVRPNPTNDFLRVVRDEVQEVNLTLYNTLGTKVLTTTTRDRITQLAVDHLKGIFFLELSNDTGRGYQKVVIE